MIVTSGATNTPTPTNTPGPTSTPTKTSTPGGTNTPTVPPTVTPTTQPTFQNASFIYDGDGKRVKSIINNAIITYFVGAHYEVSGSTVTKYYYAGAQRIAMRSNGTLNYLLGDHLGSTSLTTDAAGNKISEVRYKAWGEVRYASGNVHTKYQYTGQYSYEAEFGLYFYNARWYDSSLGRFAQADSIIAGGVQGYDRYAYVSNNPLRYTDPSGHCSVSVNRSFIPGVGWIMQLLNALCPSDNDNDFLDIGKDVLTIDELEYTGPDMPVRELPEWGNDVIDLGGNTVTENKDLPTNDSPLALMSTSANDDGEDTSSNPGSFDERFSDERKARQAEDRGWTNGLIDDLIENFVETKISTNLKTGNSATVYYDSDGNYIVIDDVTGQIFHVNDRNDPEWYDPFGEQRKKK